MQQTARYAAPPSPPDPAGMARLCAALGVLCETEGRRALSDDGWAEMADRVCELTALARAQSFAWTLRAAELAAARAEGFEEGRASVTGRHRAPRRLQGQLWPRAVPAVIPAAIWAAIRHAAAPAATTAAAVSLAAASYVTLPGTGYAPGHHPRYAAASLAPAAGVLISPVAAPSYQPRHAGTDADSASPVPSSAAPPRVVPSVPRQPAPAAAAGILDVATVRAVTGQSGTAEIDFEAVGGPVTWWAWASPGITLSASTGTLTAGQPMALTVTAAGTGGTVWVSSGGHVVAVPVAG